MLKLRNALHGLTAALLLAVAVTGGGVWAQTAEPARLAIQGYDPVAYFTEGRPVPGKADFEYTFDEARYRFTSDKHIALFRAEPDRYAPQFGGSCAGGISAGMKVDANPENWLIHNGRLFVFSVSGAKEKFQANAEAKAAAADANWQQLKGAPVGTKLTQ